MRGGKDTNHLAVAVINALTSHICVLDRRGTIIAVNHAWRQIGASNSLQDERSGIGTNFLTVCQSVEGEEAKDALAFHDGILRCSTDDVIISSSSTPATPLPRSGGFSLA